MPGSHTDFPPGERSPLVSIAGLPAAVPVARFAAPASPTSVQTASAAAWRSAASDARSRFRATAVAHVAPAPRLSMLPPEEDSDPEASWLPCAEYRMNLRAAIRSAQKKLCKRTSHVTPTAADPTSAPVAANRCLLTTSITAPASTKPSRPPLAATRNVHAPTASRIDKAHRHRTTKL